MVEWPTNQSCLSRIEEFPWDARENFFAKTEITQVKKDGWSPLVLLCYTTCKNMSSELFSSEFRNLD